MKDYLIIIFIIALCVSPAFALGEGNRNLLLIGLMGVTPLILVSKPMFMPRVDLGCVFICTALIIFPLLAHPDTMRWSTVLYSCMFFLLFATMARLCKWSDFSLQGYTTLLRWLIYAFSVVLIIQQFCVLMGLPIFNVSNYYLLEPWKLNSLTSEPSHTARFLTVLMYSFLWMQRLENGGETLSWKDSYKNDKWVWIAFLWVMLTMMSGTAMLMLCAVLFSFLSRKHIAYVIMFVVAVAIFGSTIEYKPVQRFYKFSEAVLSLDKNKMVSVDHSASMRVVPFITCVEQINLSTADGWFGKGIDHGTRVLYQHLKGVRKGYTGGGYALLSLEYGFIVFLMLCAFTLFICYNRESKIMSLFLWFICCFGLGVNTQIGWAFIILSYINNHFNSKQNEITKCDETQIAC